MVMQKFLVLILMLAVSLTASVHPIIGQATAGTMQPLQVIELGDSTLSLYFQEIPQGRTALLSIDSAAREQYEIQVFGRTLPFFELNGDPLAYSWITVAIDRPIRAYEITVRNLTQPDQNPLVLYFNVVSGNFIQQQVTLIDDSNLETLLNPEIESQELGQIVELASNWTPLALWDHSGFLPPLQAELTSPFGAVRVFNQSYNTIHTGWDFQAQMGMPMTTSASGRIVFSGLLPIRGHYILIDHGAGVYSGYAHLSVSYVTTGQLVKSGQIIGLVGSTGRSSSAHAHLEFLVDGIWIDGADFLRMQIPVSPVGS
jgi:murein DD-endopeptidase MepM/ murein hydrolase activator NlpD